MADLTSIEHTLFAFLTERRLTDIEATEVMRFFKRDSRAAWLSDKWDLPWSEIVPPVRIHLLDVLRERALAWMDRHNERHPARCLFTGES